MATDTVISFTVPASLDRMDRLNWHFQLPDTMFLTAK